MRIHVYNVDNEAQPLWTTLLKLVNKWWFCTGMN